MPKFSPVASLSCLSVAFLLAMGPARVSAQTPPAAEQGTPAAAVETVPVTPGAELNQTPAKKGWFWYLDPKKKTDEDDEPAPASEPVAAPPQPSSQPLVVVATPASAASATSVIIPGNDSDHHCEKQDTWEAKCGFVDPGDNFAFQAKERDILLQEMSLTPDQPDAVEAAQRYMKWVVGKATMAANMWYFNMVQHPDLDPTVKNPISQVGIALATRIDKASQIEYFDLIREEGGVLFFFSRDDCAYCHEQAPFTQRVAKSMGLELINVPLDGKCLDGFSGETCGSNITNAQVAPLQVSIVPALYLYVPNNTWIRLATGMASDTTILSNTVNFFSAYRAAMLHGLDNGNGVRPSVTFDPQYNAKPTGVTNADGSSGAEELDRGKLLTMMGYGSGTSGVKAPGVTPAPGQANPAGLPGQGTAP
jgi:hypothetical protein